jgi:hypothetical protein
LFIWSYRDKEVVGVFVRFSCEDYFGYIVDIANDGNGLIRRFNYEK